ncbi:hypothetical protein DFH27DRAFT_597466 [Peziza echinospora]|nr:hypothetical protein DFH27DRAFT_597466 [Peziza echinospora]
MGSPNGIKTSPSASTSASTSTPVPPAATATSPSPSNARLALLLLATPAVLLGLSLSPFQAHPPPSPLALQSPKPPYALHPNFTLPPNLLTLSLLLPYHPILTPGFFLPAIAACHINALDTGSRSTAVGFGVGTFIVFHMYQSIALLLSPLGGRTWRRWIPSPKHKDGGYWEPYPEKFGWNRLAWAWEMSNSLRMVGWDNSQTQSNSPPVIARSPPSSQPSAKAILYASLKRILMLWVLADLAVWNIRVNDTGYFLPLLLHPNYTTLPAGSSALLQQPDFRRNIPHLALSPESFVPASVIPPPRYFLPYPRELSSGAGGDTSFQMYIYGNIIYPAILHIYRLFFQGLCLAIGIEGVFQLLRIAFMSVTLFLLPQRLTQSTRWFSPLVWQGSISAPTGGLFEIWYPFRSKPTQENGKPNPQTLPIRAFWTRTWHSLFKNTFTSTSAVLLKPVQWVTGSSSSSSSRERPPPLALVILTSFVLSGLMHAVGIHVQINPQGQDPTRYTHTYFRGQGAFLFFVLQPLGMLLEYLVFVKIVGPLGIQKYKWMYKALEVAVLVGWLCVSVQCFMEEYRYSGIWKVEAVPTF